MSRDFQKNCVLIIESVTLMILSLCRDNAVPEVVQHFVDITDKIEKRGY